MYDGENAIALQSRQWLTESLVVLMHEKPYGKITVTDIYRRADLSRQTFYNLFKDKDEILRFYLHQQYYQPLERLRARKDTTASEIVSFFAEYLNSNQEFLNIMLENSLEGLLINECINNIYLLADRFLNLDSADSTMPYFAALLSGAIVNVMICWIKQGASLSATELNTVVNRFLSGDLVRST